jgi:colanic acid biosynthesis glycosyl transferase WcaI
LKILIHNYGGYPYSRQLAECLTRRGHEVEYLYSQTTQQIQRVARHAEQPNLSIRPIVLAGEFNKYAFLRRRAGETEHGRRMAQEIGRFRPQVVLSADTPLDAQRIIQRECRRQGAKFVFWLQDMIGLATRRILGRKLGWIGDWIGRYYQGLERRLLRGSDMIIANSPDFVPLLRGWGIGQERVRVIENWAPLEELPVQPKRNPWSEKMGLADSFCFLYTGILGFKHDPQAFVQLAQAFDTLPQVWVVVVADGEAAGWLRQEKARLGIEQLVVLSYQPAEEYAQVLGTGDVLLTVLNGEAGSYSVPSKVLSYLCAGRAQLLSISPTNLAARTVLESQAGLVSASGETEKWLSNAKKLYEEQGLREQMGANARQYAETKFDIERITDRFEEIIAACCK